jgi:hypothetical protein
MIRIIKAENKERSHGVSSRTIFIKKTTCNAKPQRALHLVTKQTQVTKQETEEIRKKRADIPMPNVDPMANAWEKDKKNFRQFVITNKADSAMHKHQSATQSEKH